MLTGEMGVYENEGKGLTTAQHENGARNALDMDVRLDHGSNRWQMTKPLILQCIVIKEGNGRNDTG